MGMASAETGSNEATIKGQILAYTEDWFTDNFSEHYDISDYEASVNNFSTKWRRDLCRNCGLCCHYVEIQLRGRIALYGRY